MHLFSPSYSWRSRLLLAGGAGEAAGLPRLGIPLALMCVAVPCCLPGGLTNVC